MLKPLLTLASVIVVLIVAMLLSRPRRVVADEAQGHDEHEHPELAKEMAWLQRWTMKLGYSIAAKNDRLADLYMHELEETVEAIVEEIPEYEGLKIALATGVILKPELEPLAEKIDRADWPGATEHYARLIDACNRCHAATQHEFIVITVPEGEPPFNQRF